MDLYTFGHGTADETALSEFIKRSDIQHLVDVRTVPKSARHPWVAADRLEIWVPERTKATYELLRDLGGFRKPLPSSPNLALRNTAFRGYADYMGTASFRTALATLLEHAARERTTVMCSETLWWRCHRRLIADAATLLHEATVYHLTVKGKPNVHVPTQGVRIDGDRLRYDVAAV